MHKLTVIEPYELLDATYSLDLVEIRFLQLAFANIYRINGVLEDVLYEVDLEQFAEEFSLKRDTAYRALKEVCTSLIKRTLTLKSALIDASAKKSEVSIIHWLEEVRYDSEASTVKLKWSKSLIPLLNDLGRDNLYSKYLLDNTKDMKCIHSVRLFRLLNKWKMQGKIKWKLKEFRRLMGIEEDTYVSILNFRRDVIEKGVKDINNLSGLEVKYESIKEGRRIVGWEFWVRDKGEEGVRDIVEREDVGTKLDVKVGRGGRGSGRGK
jgi:Protein involved in initiation of plasmid replication